ncbi:Protein of unknown function [Ruminococcaceae bacterium YRB3002]|nr:Protein of unknown function [Ruminococcaceae bacterium YRB3002]
MEETKDRRSKIISFAVVLGVIVTLGVFAVLGIYNCPMKLLFGLPCPLCGITRAFTAVIKLDFKEAFYYHPLWPVIAVVIIAETLNELSVVKIPQKANNIALIIVAAMLLVCYVIRLVTGTWV